MSTAPLRKFSIHEYLEIETTATMKHQFYRGEIFAMPGGSLNHARIIRNLGRYAPIPLDNTTCEYLTEAMRVYCSSDLLTYPDGIIISGKPEFDGRNPYSLVNPRVIFEVMSPSTEHFDRGQKFLHYQQISTLVEYVLIAQDEPLVEQFIKQPDGDWSAVRTSGLAAELSLFSVPCRLPLSELYDRVDFIAAAE